MKRSLAVFLVAMLFFAVTIYAQDLAKEDSGTKNPDDSAFIDTTDMGYQNSPVNKLGRGFVNILTCLLEVPVQMCMVAKEKNAAAGCTIGFMGGIWTGFLRGAGGFFDVVTFIVPPYNKLLVEPEYIFDTAKAAFKE